MKQKALKLAALAACALLTWNTLGCSKSETNQTDKTVAANGASGSESTPTTAASTTGKYKLKSAIVHSRMAGAMGMVMKLTTYFDNYGAKESQETESEMKMMGQTIKIHNITLVKDGWIYNIDLTKKTGTRHKGSSISGDMNYANLSSEMAKKYNVKHEGDETVAGKVCEVYSMDDGKNMKGRVASWQGIPMKLDMQMAGMPVKQQVESIEADVPVPADKFEVPADIKITDI